MSRPARILVIDDEEAARYGISRALANQGYTLEEAADGTSALERIKEFQPDVIISDINMPGVDGLSLLRQVRREAAEPPLVVLVTAYGSEAVAAEALRAGAYDYLSKPFDVEQLRAVARNAVERQRLERELKQSRAALLHAEKMASLGRLVAGVAHEINTPLGVIQSNTQTAARAAHKIGEWSRAQPPETGEAVKRWVDVLGATSGLAESACERISAIVTNLRHFARLDEAELQRAQVRDGIESAVALLGRELGGTIDVVQELAELPEIECAPRQLNQLFMNLLENAVEAIRQSGRRGAIRIRAWSDDDTLKIAVEDNGCGIRAENLEKIFDPGFTTKGVKVGTGLGLPIAIQIARAHQGRIEVESRPGEGSTFTVTLARNRPA